MRHGRVRSAAPGGRSGAGAAGGAEFEAAPGVPTPLTMSRLLLAALGAACLASSVLLARAAPEPSVLDRVYS